LTAQNVEAELQCCEIRLRAERKWRQLYDAGEKANATGSNQHQERSRLSTDPRTLAELGVTKDQAADWAKLAALSDEQFAILLATRLCGGPSRKRSTIMFLICGPRGGRLVRL
jgi:hypothetical protein